MKVRYFICKSCEGEPMFTGQDELKKHLEEIHPESPKKGNRKGILFLDGAGWYRNVFEWKLGEIKLTEIDTNQ